ncbi:hypothetical protein BD779DRAFT_1672768 [Infundibulicybe gibba]|nr:hypothetical protein BD779DRAFT_1672768 [Infundibulicybe gibba]
MKETTAPRFRASPAASSARPSVEQIAMGLHLSRTPHFRPQSHQPLPPPPARSSMKSHTPSPSVSTTPLCSASSTTITSTTPPQNLLLKQQPGPRPSIRTRFTRLLARTPPPTPPAPPPPRRKEVRFSVDGD